MHCEQLQQQRGTHQKIMDLFHALAFEVLKKFFVIQPYSFFFFFSPGGTERGYKCRSGWGLFVWVFFLFNTNSFCMSTVYQVPFCYFSNTTIMPKMLMLGVCLWNFFF